MPIERHIIFGFGRGCLAEARQAAKEGKLEDQQIHLLAAPGFFLLDLAVLPFQVATVILQKAEKLLPK